MGVVVDVAADVASGLTGGKSNTVSSIGDVASGALKEAEKFVNNTVGSLEATVNGMVAMAEKNPLEFAAHVGIAVASGGGSLTWQQAALASAGVATASALSRGEKLEDALVAGAKAGAFSALGAQAGQWAGAKYAEYANPELVAQYNTAVASGSAEAIKQASDALRAAAQTATQLGSKAVAAGLSAADAGKDPVQAMLTAGITNALGTYAGEYVEKNVLNSINGAAGVTPELAKFVAGISGATVAGGVSGAATAIVFDQDPLEAMRKGGVSAATMSIVKNIPGYAELEKTAAGKTALQAVNAAVAAKLRGRDPTQAAIQAAYNTGVQEFGKYIGNTYSQVSKDYEAQQKTALEKDGALKAFYEKITGTTQKMYQDSVDAANSFYNNTLKPTYDSMKSLYDAHVANPADDAARQAYLKAKADYEAKYGKYTTLEAAAKTAETAYKTDAEKYAQMQAETADLVAKANAAGIELGALDTTLDQFKATGALDETKLTENGIVKVGQIDTSTRSGQIEEFNNLMGQAKLYEQLGDFAGADELLTQAMTKAKDYGLLEAGKLSSGLTFSGNDPYALIESYDPGDNLLTTAPEKTTYIDKLAQQSVLSNKWDAVSSAVESGDNAAADALRREALEYGYQSGFYKKADVNGSPVYKDMGGSVFDYSGNTLGGSVAPDNAFKGVDVYQSEDPISQWITELAKSSDTSADVVRQKLGSGFKIVNPVGGVGGPGTPQYQLQDQSGKVFNVSGAKGQFNLLDPTTGTVANTITAPAKSDLMQGLGSLVDYLNVAGQTRPGVVGAQNGLQSVQNPLVNIGNQFDLSSNSIFGSPEQQAFYGQTIKTNLAR